MQQLVVINQRNRNVVSSHTCFADSWRQRLIGLLTHNNMQQGEGLWLRPCQSIHTLGMKFSIDVVFLDKQNCIKKMACNIRPFRFCWSVKGTQSVLELPIGTIASAKLLQGDQLLIETGR